MNSKLLLSVALLAAVVLLAAGCGDKSSTTSSPSGDSTTSVKTMDEYRSEAGKEITKDNAEAELDKLEKEIDADQ